MKRILNKLFSKLVLGGLIIILQFSWFVYLLYSATVYSSMVDALFKIASIVLALFVSSRDMRSTYKTSWIFLILALPLFGIPAYYLFGRPKKQREVPCIRKILEVLYVERISLLETNNASTMDAILNNASTMELYTVALYNR